MITVENLTKRFGDLYAIMGLTFEVKKGEVVGFLGPNGAGKTTTMRVLTGYMPPTMGKAVVAGYDVFYNPMEVKRRIGYLPEQPPLYTDMLVKGYLQFVAEVKGVPRTKRASAVDKVLAECGLDHVAGRLISNLSKGYRQRIGLAQALISDPEVLILDEPTIGLDPKQIVEIREIIKNLRGERTIILSTHILPEVMMTCTRVLIINNGRLVAEDTIEHISESSRVLVKIQRPPKDAIATLKSITGVIKARAQDELAFEIEVDPKEKNVAEAIADKIVRQGWGLIELKPVAMSLEDVYMKHVTSETQERTVSAESAKEASAR